MYRASVNPVGHESIQSERGGYGRTLEVLGLTGGVLGDVVRRDVEAREAGQTAEDEESETQVVERGTHTNGEGHDCGSKAKGNLYRHKIASQNGAASPCGLFLSSPPPRSFFFSFGDASARGSPHTRSARLSNS